MSDTETPLSEQAAPPPAPRPAVTAKRQITGLVPTDIDQAYRLAQALAQSGDMIPQNYRGQPTAILAAIAKGLEVGLAPMQALSSITVINGRPSIWGDALPALVQRAGHHIDVEMEGEGDKRRAIATLTRADGRTVVRTFSVDDAKKAKLWGKGGPWSAYPDRMLAMRARAFACRDGAADALMGLSIGEEVSDYGPATARDITPQAPRKGGVAYKPLGPRPTDHPDPPVDEILDGATEAEPEPTQDELELAMEAAKVAADAGVPGDDP